MLAVHHGSGTNAFLYCVCEMDAGFDFDLGVCIMAVDSDGGSSIVPGTYTSIYIRDEHQTHTSLQFDNMVRIHQVLFIYYIAADS